MLRPYSYTRSPDDVYTFYTDHLVKYTAYFTEACDYFADYPEIKDNALNFGFAPDRSAGYSRKFRDKRIQHTVVAILEHYLNVRPNAIIFFICDTRDRQHFARKLLFDKWYSSNPAKEIYFKIDEDICAGGDCAHCSVIFSKKHRESDLIVRSFASIALQIRNK